MQYEVCRDWLIKLDSVDVPVAPGRDLADLDRLLRLMGQRLALVQEVARCKWNACLPVTDAQRERELLHSVVERGRGKGLDPEQLRSFFAAQAAGMMTGCEGLSARLPVALACRENIVYNVHYAKQSSSHRQETSPG